MTGTESFSNCIALLKKFPSFNVFPRSRENRHAGNVCLYYKYRSGTTTTPRTSRYNPLREFCMRDCDWTKFWDIFCNLIFLINYSASFLLFNTFLCNIFHVVHLRDISRTYIKSEEIKVV